ncbi:MAG: uncharacterized protein QOF17_1090, partial [Solirubrobacteraceae bacterium]|nr:uncharacterized protein [Solirubrobacteraceae bacterium]
FPLHPPGRPEKTRAPELDAVRAPVLVIQGERDPFGRPEPATGRAVVLVPGTHALRSAGPVRDAVGAWLEATLGPAARRGTRARRGA